MLSTAPGPFLFDTSAESWLARTKDAPAQDWFAGYLSRHRVNVSAITVIERVRGYALLRQTVQKERRQEIEAARIAYLSGLGNVLEADAAVAVVSGEIMAVLPHPPTPPRRTRQLAESRQDRLVRWRFDCIIAATALVTGLPLIHNNAADFEPIRGAVECNPDRFPGLGPLELIRCASVILKGAPTIRAD